VRRGGVGSHDGERSPPSAASSAIGPRFKPGATASDVKRNAA
jgi:hypothetical protein